MGFFKNNFSWDRRTFILLLISVLPIIVLSILIKPEYGTAGLLGMIPAVYGGVRPKRKERIYILLLGILIPVSLLIGTFLKTYLNMWLIALAMAILGVVAVMLNTKFKWAPIVLAMVIPIIAIGLSYSGFETPIMLFVIMIVGSLSTFIISLFFPEREDPPAPEPRLLPPKAAKVFSVLYGAALATASILGFNLDHTGWVVGSTAFVMRPAAAMEEFRSVWRMIAILIGVTAVSLVLLMDPNGIVVVLISALVIAFAGGLHNSKAYIMPAFITYVVFSFLLYPVDSVQEVYYRYFERVSWVSIGIAVAAFFGLLLPIIIRRIKKRGTKNEKNQ